jgi:hypothetical protein
VRQIELRDNPPQYRKGLHQGHLAVDYSVLSRARRRLLVGVVAIDHAAAAGIYENRRSSGVPRRDQKYESDCDREERQRGEHDTPPPSQQDMDKFTYLQRVISRVATRDHGGDFH